MRTAQTDVIVIGSGFGGAITAARLAEAGVKVTLLERGPWRDTIPTRSMGIERREPLPRGLGIFSRLLRTVNHRLLPGGRMTFNRKGLFELFYSPGMEVVCSSSVGGGSHVYSAVHRRPLAEDYWDGYYDCLTEATMDVHARAFLTRMGSDKPGAHNRPPLNAVTQYSNDPDFEPAVPNVDVRVGFLLPEDPAKPKRIVTDAGVERWETDYTSGTNGFLGSVSGAKSTLDIVYLAPALKKGLEVRDLCEVRAIRRLGNGAGRYRVDFVHHGGTGRQSLTADHVIVAAGTLNTLRLLLQSRNEADGPSGMPNLGKGFSGNGDIRGFWDLNQPGSDLTQGLPSKGGFLLRKAPEPRAAIARNHFPDADSYPFPRPIRERLKRGYVISGMGIDAGDGVVSLKNTRLGIDFDPQNSPIYGRIYDTMQEVARLSGRKVYAGRRPSTVHPMGGARLGPLDRGGVVDAGGQVHGNPGLYVADAAALPAPTGSAPTQSIGTWAENVASRFLANA